MTDILGIIKTQREARGWSEYQLAERSGLPQSTISSWYKKDMTTAICIVGEDMRRLWHHTFAILLQTEKKALS